MRFLKKFLAVCGDVCNRCGDMFAMRWEKVLVMVAVICFFSVSYGFSQGMTAVLKSPRLVERLDARTGAFRGSISVSDAVGIGCDGETIAVLNSQGRVQLYDAASGSFRGSISVGKNAKSIQVSNGVILVIEGNRVLRYDAKRKTYLGSTSL